MPKFYERMINVKNTISKKLTAAIMSAVMAAAAVPAAVIASASVAPSVDYSAAKTASVATVGVGDAERLYTADYVKSTDKFINITFTPDFTGNFNFGFGIGTKTAPYWYELDGKSGSFIDTKGGTVDAVGTDVKCVEGQEVTISIDISKIDVKFDPSTAQYPGEFEFRNYYAGESKSSITITSISGSATSQASEDPTDPSDPTKPSSESSVPNNNKHSNGENSASGKSWSFVDNGDGTATISSTLAKQIDPEALGEILLTKGYDEDYYAANPDEDVEGKPINSHKFKFSDFGITDMNGVTIESLTCTIESGVAMDQFIYGGGLNVQYQSDADTEYAKQLAGIEGKSHAGYWYNDMGEDAIEEFESQGVKFLVTPGTGGKITEAGDYIEAYWEVPAEVQPFTSTTSSDAISFQYWWGNDTEGEEVESVTLTNAVITYTKTVTVPFTDSVATAVSKVVDFSGDDEAKNLEISYEDLGLDETKDVYAIRFDLTADADMGKIVYNIGTGVTERVSKDYWYQESGNYCVLDAGDTAEIMWIVPTIAAGDEEHENGINTKDGKVQFGYYYGETDAVTIDNIVVYYADEPVTTTTTTTTKATTTTTTTTTTKATTTTTTATTTTTTAVTTTTEPELTVTLWGDANCDNHVLIGDAVLILQSIANKDKYGIGGSSDMAITKQGTLNANVVDNETTGVTAQDALAIQMMDAGIIKQADFPVTNAALSANK